MYEEILDQYSLAFPGCFDDKNELSRLIESIQRHASPDESSEDVIVIEQHVLVLQFERFCVPKLIQHFAHFRPYISSKELDRLVDLLRPSLNSCIGELSRVKRPFTQTALIEGAHLRLRTSIVSTIAQRYPDEYGHHHHLAKLSVNAAIELHHLLISTKAKLTLRSIQLGREIGTLLTALQPYGVLQAAPLIMALRGRVLESTGGLENSVSLTNKELRRVLISVALQFLHEFEFSLPISAAITGLFVQVNKSIPADPSNTRAIERRDVQITIVQYFFLCLILPPLKGPSTDPFISPVEQEACKRMLSDCTQLIVHAFKDDAEQALVPGASLATPQIIRDALASLAKQLEPQLDLPRQ